MSGQVALLVLNWNNAPDTLECLQSLDMLDSPGPLVIVVDNGSTDDSVQVIRQRFPHRLLLETRRNLGYAGGNNFGMHYAVEHGASYIGILNNDVKVAPDFLAPLVSALDQHPDVGMVSPLVAELSDPDSVWALGQAVDRHSGAVSRAHAGEHVSSWRGRPALEVDAASGTALLVKREVLERVGLLDDSFYLYYEEMDWCLRVRQVGYRILALPASVVWHAVSGTLGQSSPVVDYYMLRNHLRLISRHWTGAARLRILFQTVLRDLKVIVAYTAKPQGGKRLPHRNARALALRDVVLRRSGRMGDDVEAVCYPKRAPAIQQR